MQPPGALPVERRRQRRHRRRRAAAPEPRRRSVASGAIAALAIALAACTTTPAPVVPPSSAESAPVVRTPLPEAAASRAPPAAVVVPPGVQYVCVVDAGGERRQTTIEFAPKVADLCARHPEMGPCQYERNLCRRSGGRVYAAGGVEITMATEAEYDRKVMRVRFKAN